MNCASCNTPLTPGSNTCPNCGALNMAFGVQTPVVNQNANESAMPTPVTPVVEESVIPTPVVNTPVQPQVVQTQPQVVQTQVVQAQPQVVQPQVVQQAVQPQIVQTQPVVEQPVMAQVQEESAMPQVEMPAMEMPMQAALDVPEVATNVPTLGDNDGVAEQNESLEIIDETSYVTPKVVEPVIPVMQNQIVNDDEEIQVTATMAPPTLNIQDDYNLGAGAVSIQNAEVSTYSPEEMAEQAQEEKKNERREKDNVNFAIPSVTGPAEAVTQEVIDGGVPDVVMDTPTAGDGDGIVEGNESQQVIEEEPKKDDKTKKKGLNLPTLNLKELKKTKSLPFPFVIIAIVIFFIIGIVLGTLMFGTPTYKAGSYRNSMVNTDELPRVADGKNNVTRAGAFTYKIPETYYYDRVKSGVAIYDKDDTFRIYIRSDVGIYDDLATAKTSVIKTLEQQKVVVNNYKETAINKKNYVVIQGTTNTVNRTIAFTDAGHDYIFYIEIVTKDNKYNDELVSIADDIIRNVKFNEDTAEMELIDVFDISEVVIKASMEYKKINK